MGKQRNKCDEAARRAWRVVRLALLWARKGGLLKCRLVAEIRHMPKYLKGNHHKDNSMIRYGERELSFDETPVFHFRMRHHESAKFKFPCIKPEVIDFDYDFDGDDDGGDYEDVGSEGRKSLVKGNEVDNGECEDEGIDVKAEEFISKFYAQMKMQRQISFQQRQQRRIALL